MIPVLFLFSALSIFRFSIFPFSFPFILYNFYFLNFQNNLVTGQPSRHLLEGVHRACRSRHHIRPISIQ